MYQRGRHSPSRREEPSGPRFCARCGGALTAQGATSPTNVCRCRKAEKEQQRQGSAEGADKEGQ